MLDATIKITMPSEKRVEILQTFKAILGLIRREQGCMSCNCYLDIEAENNLLFKEQWHNREDWKAHLQSAHFRVLLGTLDLLSKEPDIRFDTIASTEGAEAVKAARALQPPVCNEPGSGPAADKNDFGED
jgi:quinol monooxygenase YgiN